MNESIFNSILILCLLSTNLLYAQTTETIVKKYYQAIGGNMASDNIKSYRAYYTSPKGKQIKEVIHEHGIKNTFIQEKDTLVEVFSNDSTWTWNNKTKKLDTLSNTKKMIYSTEIEFLPLLIAEYKISGDKYIGNDTIQGVPFQVLELFRMNSMYYLYFDKDGLLSIIEHIQEGDTKVYFYSDYRLLDFGYKVPFITTIVSDKEGTTKVSLQNIEINPNLQADIFIPKF